MLAKDFLYSVFDDHFHLFLQIRNFIVLEINKPAWIILGFMLLYMRESGTHSSCYTLFPHK